MRKLVCHECGKNVSLTMGNAEKRIVMRQFSPEPCPDCQSDKVEIIII